MKPTVTGVVASLLILVLSLAEPVQAEATKKTQHSFGHEIAVRGPDGSSISVPLKTTERCAAMIHLDSITMRRADRYGLMATLTFQLTRRRKIEDPPLFMIHSKKGEMRFELSLQEWDRGKRVIRSSYTTTDLPYPRFWGDVELYCDGDSDVP